MVRKNRKTLIKKIAWTDQNKKSTRRKIEKLKIDFLELDMVATNQSFRPSISDLLQRSGLSRGGPIPKVLGSSMAGTDE